MPSTARDGWTDGSARRAGREPSLDALVECVTLVLDAIGSAREFPFPLAYLPSGSSTTRGLERYLRSNIERSGMSNDFRVLYRTRGEEL